MKISSVLLLASVLAATLGGSVVAQDRMINGVTVSPEQMDDVQIRCDELRAESAGATSTDTVEAPAADAPAAGATDDAAATESQAEEPVAPSEGEAAAEGGNMASTGSPTSTTSDGDLIDVGSLTYEQCMESGFYEAM